LTAHWTWWRARADQDGHDRVRLQHQHNGGHFAPVSFTGSRTFVLPSANLRYELIPNKLILRATATSVAAPDLSKIAPSMSLNTAL
jgi:hypothetical protein